MASELKPKQRQELSDQLVERRSELREIVREELERGQTETHAELAGRVHDAEDEALADMLVDAQLSGLERHVQELRHIEGALQRISNGTYGVCIDCGSPIDVERLRAWPTAERCIDCQEQFERTHDTPGPNTL